MPEYAIMVRTAELSPAIENATADEVTENLTPPLTELAQEMSQFCETLQGGDWVIVSHNLATLNHHLLVTFLLCR